MIVLTSSVTLDTATGPMLTYVHRPAVDAGKGTRSGIVLFSEIFQQTPPIARVAAMLAGHGFVVAVPEIFHELEPAGTVLPYDQVGTDAGNRHKTEKPIAAFDADATRAIDYLLSRDDASGAVGAFGVCIGGHLALRASFDPRVRATACFYATDVHKGSLGKGGDDSLARLREGAVAGELMMVWGRQDPHVDDEGRVKIEAALREGKARYTWHEFNAAHAFLRDEGPRYDPALALTCYRMAIDLFARM
jgi:carboxymethylenebutenolidase